MYGEREKFPIDLMSLFFLGSVASVAETFCPNYPFLSVSHLCSRSLYPLSHRPLPALTTAHHRSLLGKYSL